MPNPSIAPNAVLVELGAALEIRYVDDTGCELIMRFKSGTPCLWSPRARAVVIPTAAKKGKRVELDNTPPSFRGRVAEASRTFRAWTGHRRDPTHTRALTITTGKARRLGPVTAIAYRSDKFHEGRTTDYEHATGKGVEAIERGDVVIVRGGTLRLTARGLEG